MDIIPEIFVSLMFYSCGAWMALNVVVGGEIYESVILWPEIVGIISACLVGVFLFFTRTMLKKVIFVHFYLLGCGATLLVICGVLCIISTASSIAALYVGAIGHGVIYIAGLCYIHFRASGRRAFRLALCHLIYVIGYVTTMHGYIIYGDANLFTTTGNFIVYSAAAGVLLFLVNELAHGLALYNYKKCLDSELHLANEKKDGFQSALDPPTNTASDSNYWATRLNVQPIVFSDPNMRRLRQQNVLTLGLILSKFKNALPFLFIFMVFTVLTTAFIGQGLEFIYLYFLLGGVIFGCVISLTVNAKHLYIVYTLAFSTCIVIASVLFSVDEEFNDESAVFFWLFYFFLGFGYFLPDIGILDVTNLQFTEIALSGGFFIQYMLIALTKFGHFQFVNPDQTAVQLLWKYTGSFVGLSLLLLIIISVLYPKTLNLSLLDIQYAILFNEDRWKAKNHEILAVGSTSPPVSSQPNPRSETAYAPSQQSDERPAFMKAQSVQGSLPRPVSSQDQPMFHHPWYPQHPPNVPLQTNGGQGSNGLDNPAFDYGSVKARQLVPRINKI